MPIIREKIIKKLTPKIPLKNISNTDKYEEFNKKFNEKEDKKIQAQKNKELDKIKEDARLEAIVMPYLDKTLKQFQEKDAVEFWTFPDRSGFKKIKNTTFPEMQRAIKLDINKYAGRKICLIKNSFIHNDDITDVWRQYGILLIVHISIFHIDDKGMLNGKYKATGCTFNWHVEDFKITKLTFKLLETIMQPIAKGIHECSSLSGFPVGKVIKDLEKKGINFTDVLSPLGGC